MTQQCKKKTKTYCSCIGPKHLHGASLPGVNSSSRDLRSSFDFREHWFIHIRSGKTLILIKSVNPSKIKNK